MENIKITQKNLVGELEKSRQRIIELEAQCKLMQEKLHNSEKRSLSWLENSPVCTKIVDLDFNLQYMSGAGVNGLQIKDITQHYGKPYPIEFYPKSFKSNMNKCLKKVTTAGDIITLEDSIFDVNGKELWFHSTLVPVNDDNGKLDYILIVSIDITERKELEQQLRQSQKMEAIGILTGGIAHEFNNLLSPILGYTEMLLKNKSNTDPDKSDLEQIYSAGNRSKTLVQQLLAYGRQSISQKESIQLDVLVDEALKLIQNTMPSNISIKKEVEVNLPRIWGMPNEIHQILLNLCINASGAMKDGGILTITLKNKKSQKGDFITLSVQDTGKGMMPDILERIFDPFFTTKDIGEGSGLGLSVVQGIVEQHGGNIKVNSKVGKGSTFHIHFPVSHKKTKPSIVKTESLSQGNERILLVDDAQTVLLLNKRMLEKLGYKVTEFLDCAEALKQFTKSPKDFDLVITDYGMQKMNGKQFAEKLKEVSPDIPIILFTGYGDLVAKDDVSLWKINDLLLKPCNLQGLSDSVVKALKDTSDCGSNKDHSAING